MAEERRRSDARVRGRGAGRRWDEASFFAELHRTSGEGAVAVGRGLLHWATERRLRIWWGRGQQTGSFIPVLDHEGHGHQFVGVWTSGTLEVQFQYMASRGPFADQGRRRALLERLNAIPGAQLRDDALGRRPNIPLAAFAASGHRAALLATLDWVLAEIRAPA